MSHIVTIQTEVRDPAAIQAACQRLKIAAPQEGTFRLFSEDAAGVAVTQSDWRYPVVADTKSGTLHFDTFGGQWGEQHHLDQFLQAYALERAKLEVASQSVSCDN